MIQIINLKNKKLTVEIDGISGKLSKTVTTTENENWRENSINTDLTTKCRILSLCSEYSFVIVSALTIVNFEIACGISKYNWYNLTNKNGKTEIELQAQSVNSLVF